MELRKVRINLIIFTLSLIGSLLFAWSVATPTTADSTIHYVALNTDCGAATPCYAILQAAIDAAEPSDEILVAQGVYTDVNTREYDLTGPTYTITQAMFIDKSLTVRGGYTITDWTTAQPITYPTIIDSQGRGRGGFISIPDWDTDITVTLEGLSITHGYAKGSGGGLHTYGGNIVISGCHIYSNTGGSLAGGLYLSSDSVTLAQNRIAHNTGEYGVVVAMGVPVRLSDNYIVDNDNGLLLWGNRVFMTNTVIADNAGTGLDIIGSEVHAWHTTIADNGTMGADVTYSAQGGSGHLAMTNTIIAGPATGVQVTGMSGFITPTVQLTATLWYNVTDTHIVDDSGLITTTRDLHGDPAFAGASDYRLTAASPARNRGVPAGVAFDIIGVPRDPLPDLGAYEYDDPGSIRQVYLPLVMR